MELIAHAVPVFLALLLAEAVVARARGETGVFRFSDVLCNLSMGVGSELAGLYAGALSACVYFGVDALIPWRMPLDRVWTWLFALVAVDFAYYWWHRVSHVCNVMWAAHVTHHQSEDYNLAVALRQGWFTHITLAPFFIPVLLLGVPAPALLGVWAINLLYQFWIHTTLIGTLGVFELFLNTPSQHRVHHAVNPRYLDRNFGGIFCVWDRAFGTYQAEREPCVYGITNRLDSFDPIWANVHRLVEIFALARGARESRDRVRVWFAHPAWVPLGATPTPSDPLTRPKYEVIATPSVRRYVMVQGLATLSVVYAVLRWGPHHLDDPRLFVVIAWLLVASWAWPAMIARRPGATAVECTRHVVGAVIVSASLVSSGHAQIAALATLVALGSAGWALSATWPRRSSDDAGGESPARDES